MLQCEYMLVHCTNCDKAPKQQRLKDSSDMKYLSAIIHRVRVWNSGCLILGFLPDEGDLKRDVVIFVCGYIATLYCTFRNG